MTHLVSINSFRITAHNFPCINVHIRGYERTYFPVPEGCGPDSGLLARQSPGTLQTDRKR